MLVKKLSLQKVFAKQKMQKTNEYLNSTTAQFRRLSFFVGDKKLFLTEIQCSSNIRFSVVVNDNSVHNVTIFYVCRRHSSGPGEG